MYMKKIFTLLKQYLLTLMTLVLILCLTFYKPTGLEQTNTLANIDKAVHFLMYATLCMVFWFESFKVNLNPNMWWMVLSAVVVPIAFGGLMEYLQSALTNYRTSELGDFIFNSTGVIFAALFSLGVTRPLMRRKKHRRNYGR